MNRIKGFGLLFAALFALSACGSGGGRLSRQQQPRSPADQRPVTNSRQRINQCTSRHQRSGGDRKQ